MNIDNNTTYSTTHSTTYYSTYTDATCAPLEWNTSTISSATHDPLILQELEELRKEIAELRNELKLRTKNNQDNNEMEGRILDLE